jgi:hypothetical protein
MSLVRPVRVAQNAVGTPTAAQPYTFSAVIPGHVSFAAALANGDTVDAFADDGAGNWEQVVLTRSGTNYARALVASSTGSLIAWSNSPLVWAEIHPSRFGGAAWLNVGTGAGDVAAGNRGVTNGDTHNHTSGAGGQIAYSSLSAAPTWDNASKELSISRITQLGSGTFNFLGYYNSSGSGGALSFKAGNATGSTGNGGDVLFSAGNGSYAGGSVLFVGGVGTDGDGGVITFIPGASSNGNDGYTRIYDRSDTAVFIGPEDLADGFNLNISNSSIGFFGSYPVNVQTVTGSRGGNAALTSLIAALSAYGLILNNTTT